MKSKWYRSKKIFLLISILVIVVIVIFGYLSWFKTTPKYAIKQYCKENDLFYSILVKAEKTDVIDKNHGQLFTVEGVTTKNHEVGLQCFYLKKTDNAWKVTSVGTGP